MITVETQAAGVSIATWFLASTFLTLYVSGQIVKYAILRRFRSDDYILLSAVIFALSLSITNSIAASAGLGDRLIEADKLIVVQKTQYAADLLYITSSGLVKLSLLVFLRQIAIDVKHIRFITTLIAFVVLMTISSFLASAFQCTLPDAWDFIGRQCFDRSGFWITFGTLDVITEASFIVTSGLLVWNVQMPLSRKMVVVGCFAPRALVAVAAITRLNFLSPEGLQEEWAWKVWSLVVITEVQICLSISTACVPSLKPLFEAIEAGVWHADDLRRRGLSLEDLHSKGYLKDSQSWLALTDVVRTVGIEPASTHEAATPEASIGSRMGDLSQ
ncbi:hypothetical protein F5Y08DRAFT_320809 [Xylaria arbuscula]|nr:hypothetical protein F5Y08DRAFT_320809 [Xylaria arbuscula]